MSADTNRNHASKGSNTSFPKAHIISENHGASSTTRPTSYKSLPGSDIPKPLLQRKRLAKLNAVKTGLDKHPFSNASTSRYISPNSEHARKRPAEADFDRYETRPGSPAKVPKTYPLRVEGPEEHNLGIKSAAQGVLTMRHDTSGEVVHDPDRGQMARLRIDTPSSVLRNSSDVAQETKRENKTLVGLQNPPRRSQSPFTKAELRANEGLAAMSINSAVSSPVEILVKQLVAGRITEQQLAAEIKGIYGGLSKLEAKCIEEIQKLMTQIQLDPNVGRSRTQEENKAFWRPLIDLHRGLLQEHHDFFCASQHPAATPPLKALASKYSMAARMWKYGIYNLLELMRRHLPESLEWMVEFNYIAYSMVTLLFETVHAFEATWIECMGDLARYRMAIEEDDMSLRDIWIGVARSWYVQATELNPSVGRLYHHRAVLARSYPLEQVALYCLSLTAREPFSWTNDSINNIFSIASSKPESLESRCSATVISFIRCHGFAYKESQEISTREIIKNFLMGLENRIKTELFEWKREGVFYALTNISSIFGYGASTSIFKKLFEAQDPASRPDDNDCFWTADGVLERGGGKLLPHHFGWQWLLTWGMLRLALGSEELCTVPYVHILLIFVQELLLTQVNGQPIGHRYLEKDMEWEKLANYLNRLLAIPAVPWGNQQATVASSRALYDRQIVPEDFLINGQIWTRNLYGNRFFEPGDYLSDEAERFEEAKFDKPRIRRLLMVCKNLATTRLYFDSDVGLFFAPGYG